MLGWGGYVDNIVVAKFLPGKQGMPKLWVAKIPDSSVCRRQLMTRRAVVPGVAQTNLRWWRVQQTFRDRSACVLGHP